MTTRRRSRTAPRRGQTTLDFVVAMGLFLAVVGFVFLFVPNLLAPHTGDQVGPQVADRVADRLVTTHLGVASTPAVLNGTCTRWFFNGSSGDPCPTFEADRSLTEQFALPSTRDLNVTLVADVDGDRTPEVLCATASGIGSCAGGGSRLAVGPDPPSGSGSVVTARRVVRVEGTHGMVVVRAW